MTEMLEVDDVKNLVCALRAALGAGLSAEGEELADAVLLKLAENRTCSAPVAWILRTAANMGSAKPEFRRPHLTVIEGGDAA